MSFREILKYLRAEKGVTQVDVARGCGLTTTCICSLEQGTRNPTGSTVAALATYFDVSADYLLGLEDDFGTRTVATMGDTMTAKERELLETFRKLSPYLQGLTLETVRSFAGNTGDDGLHKKA